MRSPRNFFRSASGDQALVERSSSAIEYFPSRVSFTTSFTQSIAHTASHDARRAAMASFTGPADSSVNSCPAMMMSAVLMSAQAAAARAVSFA